MIESVEIVARYVQHDLKLSSVSEDAAEEVLGDVDELERQLTEWDRQLTDAVNTLTGTAETIYYRRQGEFRMYFVRRGSTLYCIAVGKRKKTYDRDLSTVIERARSLSEDEP